MLAPFCPHVASELWETLGNAESLVGASWPVWSDDLAREESVELPVQVNGKLRDVVSVPAGLSEIEIEQIVMSRDKVRAAIEGQDVVRVIQVAGRLVNVVVRPKG